MRALVFGGTGQIGRAVAADLARAGWQVDAVTHQRPLSEDALALGIRPISLGPSRAALVSRGYDAVFDPMAFTAADALDLMAEPAGHVTVISTASVYADAEGRGLERTEEGFPHYPDPIHEDQPLVPAGEGYSAGKVAMEAALEGRAAVLRPGAIHGIGSRHPREWWFVKRALDGRVRVPVADAGRSVFHTSSTLGIASLTRHVMEHRLTGAFNAVDPVAPTVAEIAQALGQAMGHRFDLVDHPIGQTPWSAEHPMRLSTARARATGWDGGPPYAACLPDYVAWMVSLRDTWQQDFPVFQHYGHNPFDYAAEDAALAETAPRR